MSPSRIHWRGWSLQYIEALTNRIRAGSLLTEPVRILVSSGFGHGIECKQVQGLHRSVVHGGDSEWALRLAVRFRDVNTSQGLRLIILAFECKRSSNPPIQRP